jgi:uncharacterized protein YrrD
VIRYKQLVTYKLIDKETGEIIGSIFNVIYSEDFKKINYLIVKNDNLIRNKAPVFYEDVQFLENNQALYLKNSKIFEEKLEEDIKESFKYIDKEIRNENGECVGYIKDVVINKLDGSIEGFIITEGVFEDLLKGRNYMPLFENTIIGEEYISVSNKDLN